MSKELKEIDVSGIYFVADESTYFAEVTFSVVETAPQDVDDAGIAGLQPVFAVSVNVQIKGDGSEPFHTVREALLEEGKSVLRTAIERG